MGKGSFGTLTLILLLLIPFAISVGESPIPVESTSLSQGGGLTILIGGVAVIIVGWIFVRAVHLRH